MSKKILAGILAAASILSVSATAFADSGDASSAPATTKAYDPNGATYTVSAPVSYGTVDATVPVDLNSIVINPYNAAVKTDNVKNKAFVASKVYEVKNNATDTNDGIKVMATTQVSKATGLVVVDANGEMPVGWDVATVSATDTTLVHPSGDTWNKLYTYDKITAKTDKTSGVTTYTGGGLSTKQGNNVAINLVGNTDKTKVVTTDASNKLVAFKAKGANTDELGSTTTTDKSVFFTVVGEVSDKAPCMDKSYAWGKENLSLSIVLKVVPTDLST